LTLEDQLDLFDREADRMYARCLRSFKDRKGEILAASRQRLIEGYEQYGAGGFSWPHDRLHQAELEEYADAINYRLMKAHQGWPT
jgi:hypothetical protein